MDQETTVASGAPSNHAREEMIDSLDEELEMELDDERLAQLVADAAGAPVGGSNHRQTYFKELFRL